MRSRLFSALLLAATAAGSGACAPRGQPYRFSMPMLGQADVPAETLGPADGRTDRPDGAGGRTRGRGMSDGRSDTRTAEHAAAGHVRPTYAYGWQTDAQSGIRTASAAGIELRQPEASAESAAEVTTGGIAGVVTSRGIAATRLPAPHKASSAGGAAGSSAGMSAGSSAGSSPRVASAPGGVAGAAGAATAAIELPRLTPIREPSSLRALVGTRDKREPFAIAMGWLADLGITFVEPGTAMEMATAVANRPADGPALVAWAQARGSLLAPTDTPSPGDVLVFSRAATNSDADLIGIVIARDARGVVEFAYAGGGVIRHGFVDPLRPTTRRDLSGAIVNTFLRHGKQWPAKGTRYLAGELLTNVIRVRR